MGQYYRVINLDTLEQIAPPGFAKIMEFCYIGNELPLEADRLLLPGNQWHKTRVVFCGDYCDGDEKELPLRQEIVEKLPETMGEMLEENAANSLYGIFRCFPDKGLNGGKEVKYLFNHTKREYLALADCPENKDGYTIHPLGLLTALGNGQGGGDYYGEDGADYVGYWSGDCLSSGNSLEYADFTKITPGFIER